MTAIRIIVPGAIVPWKRAQRRQFRNGAHVTFTDREVEAYHGVVRMAAADAMGGRLPIDEPIMLSLLAVFAVPASWSGKRQREALAGMRHKVSRPDMENTIKGALDAMQSIVYRDDSQIIGYRDCRKVYGGRPRLEITVEPVPHGTMIGPLLKERPASANREPPHISQPEQRDARIAQTNKQPGHEIQSVVADLFARPARV